MKAIRLAVSGALLTLTALHAAAAPNAHSGASITNVVVGLIDLTPADGATPWYQSSITLNQAYTTIDGPLGYEHDSQQVTTPVAVNSSLSHGATSASAHADVLGELKVQSNSYGDLGAETYTFGGTWQRYDITIAAHSMLTVSGQASTWANKSADAGRLFNANSWAIAELYGSNGWGRYKLASEFSEAGPISGDLIDKPFWLSYANTSDTAMTVHLSFEANGASTSLAAPVPEPSTYAMLAAGLLLTGLAARRRKLRHPE